VLTALAADSVVERAGSESGERGVYGLDLGPDWTDPTRFQSRVHAAPDPAAKQDLTVSDDRSHGRMPVIGSRPGMLVVVVMGFIRRSFSQL